MNLLAPLFLLGSLVIAIPVYLHLRRQRTRRDVNFSSLMFLRPTPIRLQSRRTPEHLVLLALRVLAVALLALAFARPYLPKPLPVLATPLGQRVVILLDHSASMRRTGLWSAALDHVTKTVSQTAAGDKVSVLIFDTVATTLMSFEDWEKLRPSDRNSALQTRIKDLRPGWGATDLGRALVRGADLILDEHAHKRSAGATGRIVLVSDLQAGASLTAVEGGAWPEGIKVDLLTVVAPQAANASLAVHAHPSTDVTRVRVSRTEGLTSSPLTLQWESAGLDATPMVVDLPGGAQRVIDMRGTPDTATGGNLRLSGDADDFDNTLFLAPPLPSEAQVVYLGTDDGTNPKTPLYFISRAFPPTNTRTTTVHGDKATRTGFLATAHLAIVAQEPEEATVLALNALLDRGGAVLITGDAPRIAERWGVATQARTTSQNAIIATVDQTHPLMLPFSEPKFSDFTRVNFWHRKVMTATPAAKTLWRFDDGTPALLVVPRGSGHILVLASGLGPTDSQLPLSSKFVPFLHALLDAGAGPAAGKTQFFVADPVPLPLHEGPARITRPDGTDVTLSPDATIFADTPTPGLYRFVSPGQVARVFAVNLAPAESLTTALAPERLERLSLSSSRPAPSATSTGGTAATAWDNDVESRQKSWRWVLMALLALFIVEIVWAARVSSATSKVSS